MSHRISSANSTPTPPSHSGNSQHEMQSSPTLHNLDPYSRERWQPPKQVVLPVFSRMDVVNHQSQPSGHSSTQRHPFDQSRSNGHSTTHHPSDPLSSIQSNVKKPKKLNKKQCEAQAVSNLNSDNELKKIRFDRQDYLNIIAYLSDPSRYNSLFGGGKKTSVTGQSMNVSTSWGLFAAHIQEMYNQRHPDKPMKLTGRNLQLRFIRYRRQYIAAKRFPTSTGSGTTSADRKRGIYTYQQKLDSICPCFSEMDDLLGEKANVTAMREWDSLISSDSEDNEDYEEEEEEDEEDQLGCLITNANDDSDIEFQSGQFIPPKPIIGSPNPSRSHTFSHLLLDKDEDILTDLESLSGTNGIFQPLSSTLENLEPFQTIPISPKPPSKVKQPVSNAKTKKPKRKSKELTKDAAEDVSERDPLPPISKPSVKTKENKNSLAQAFADASNAKMLMFDKANIWEQAHEAKKMKLDTARVIIDNNWAVNELAWAKEKFRMERKDRVEDRRLQQMAKWLAEGKTVAEVELLMRLATVSDSPSPSNK
ncbi:hypothetical protein DFH28DRAFT_1128150 [Melampsora americana]|nr:hypothetical protein DFH28DRAFT_1128150 [Melampsora americana]